MELKQITGIQIESYTEKQKLSSKKYLANKLCDDIEMNMQKKKQKIKQI